MKKRIDVRVRDRKGAVKNCRCDVCKSVRRGPSIVKIGALVVPRSPFWPKEGE
jgi:hypothetical protein